VRDLSSELFSARLDAEPSEAVKLRVLPRNRELARLREPDRDLNSELFSAKPEATVNAPLRDLNREVFPAKPEATFQVPVRVVEQERGLELQINFPESTLATMLPIVNVIEAAMALKIEVFSTKLETELSEPLSDLSIEVILARAEAEVTDPLRL
jgi:hypothetical protein